MHMFYAPEIGPGHDHFLNAEESRHTIKVLRLVPGSEVLLTNGKGTRCLAKLVDASLRAARLEIMSSQYEPQRSFSLHLAIAPTKNIDRTEWLLEKATEIGVENITFLLSARSERKELNADRLLKILIASMKQSMRVYLPGLKGPQPFSSFIASCRETRKYIAHCLPGTLPFQKTSFSRNDSLVVLVGPEGDFSPAETEAAYSAGFTPLSLGSSRLRTETAGLVVCSQLSYIMNSIV